MSDKIVVEMPNLETAAYVLALLTPGAVEIYGVANETGDLICEAFPGGSNSMETLESKINLYAIWKKLKRSLREQGIDYERSLAPWLEPTVPDEIDGNTVCYTPDGGAGIRVGCAFVSLEQMKLMVEKAEKGKDE
jgi:hypothetical protein